MSSKTFNVPKRMEQVFAKAEEAVADYFAKAKFDPERGTIEFFGERYVLVRAASLSFEFFRLLRELFGRGRRKEADLFARNLLFDLAHAIGRTDARSFHAKMVLKDPIERLSAGPVLFAHTGWAFVDILPASNPVASAEFCLVYDHPYSFEADAWMSEEHAADFPVCVMNAGYSSGWCEESFGLPLIASEIECRANGGERCRFVMAPPARLEERIREHTAGKVKYVAPVAYEIPDFFSRKRAEDALHRSLELYRLLAESSPDAITIVGTDGVVRYVNGRGAGFLQRSPDDVVGRHMEDLFPVASYERMWSNALRVFETGQVLSFDEPVDLPNGPAWFTTRLVPIWIRGGKATAVLSILHDITARKQGEERLARLNDVFAGFGTDSEANIGNILAVFGELMGATYALYNRLADGMLCSVGQWNTPPGFKAACGTEGYICSDVIGRGDDGLFVVRNLLKSPYATTDPNVIIHNLETYAGFAVRAGKETFGSLCCVWQHDYIPTAADERLFRIVAAIIGVQELRLVQQVEVMARMKRLEGEVDVLLAAQGQRPRYGV